MKCNKGIKNCIGVLCGVILLSSGIIVYVKVSRKKKREKIDYEK